MCWPMREEGRRASARLLLCTVEAGRPFSRFPQPVWALQKKGLRDEKGRFAKA